MSNKKIAVPLFHFLEQKVDRLGHVVGKMGLRWVGVAPPATKQYLNRKTALIDFTLSL